jgi:hypothetical protein
MKPITQNTLFCGDNLPILWEYITNSRQKTEPQFKASKDFSS